MAVSRYRRDSTPRHRTTTDQVPTPEWRREHRPTLLTETGEKRVRKEFMSEAVGPRTRALTEAPPQMRRARGPRRVWRRLGLGFAIVKARNDASRPRRWFLDHHRASNNNCDVSFSNSSIHNTLLVRKVSQSRSVLAFSSAIPHFLVK